MNKLEMQTLERQQLARMTTTERANHNRIKREILDARGAATFADAAASFNDRFKLPVQIHDEIEAAVPTDKPYDVPKLKAIAARVNSENPRRLSIDVTVQLAGTIHETCEDVAIDFGELAAIATAPDAELVIDAWGAYARGSILRRSDVGDEEFAKLAYRGWIAPVKRPGDGTARDYVVTAGNVVTGRGSEYGPGETVPDYVSAETILRFANFGVIELAK